LIVLAWVFVFRAEILRTRFVVLLAAGGALAFSIAADALGLWSSPRVALLVEDGAKLLGVMAWATYFVVTTHDIARSLFVAASSLPDDATVEPEASAGVSPR
jgi:hypothetical protein